MMKEQHDRSGYWLHSTLLGKSGIGRCQGRRRIEGKLAEATVAEFRKFNWFKKEFPRVA
ncbi:MAG: hypothetical protein LUQ04_09625 [Methanoregula sp.]|nr:hypothetical protein [Methanoregula sp.]